MRRVLERIAACQADYVQAPFFAFLRDTKLAPEARLAFAPHVAHFVLTFADLCRFVLPSEPPADRYQALVNANCREDAEHWRWFLSDLAELGYDAPRPFSEAVQLIWSDSTERTRALSYYLVSRAATADSLGRLALVHCIEGAFKVTVTDLALAARELAARTGKRLDYLGGEHEEAEQSHTLGGASEKRFVDSIALSDERAASLCVMVDEAFARFRAFADEMQDLALAAKDQR
jgi:hypothetical protein